MHLFLQSVEVVCLPPIVFPIIISSGINKEFILTLIIHFIRRSKEV